MIPRYTRPEMASIWEPQTKFQIWFEIEAHACDAQAELGVIPKEAAKTVWEKGAFEVDKIDEIEREVKHDVIAFLTNLRDHRFSWTQTFRSTKGYLNLLVSSKENIFLIKRPLPPSTPPVLAYLASEIILTAPYSPPPFWKK